MVFTLTALRCDAEAILQLAGELDLGTRDQLTKCVAALISSGQPVVRADLADLRFMDSSGISALLTCKRACERAGGSFQVVGAHGGVATVLRITGLDRALSGSVEATAAEEPAAA